MHKGKNIQMNKKIALIISFVLLALFGFVAVSVQLNFSWIDRLDTFGNQLFRLNISEQASIVLERVSNITSNVRVFVAAFIVGIILLWRKRWLILTWFVISIGLIGGFVPQGLKILFGRPRPTDGLFTRAGNSFPSGSTMGALAVYGLLIIFAIVYLKKGWKKALVITIATGITLFIGWSRIHLGFHYLSDVLASLLLGIGLLIIAWLVLKRVVNYEKNKTELDILYFKQMD